MRHANARAVARGLSDRVRFEEGDLATHLTTLLTNLLTHLLTHLLYNPLTPSLPNSLTSLTHFSVS